MGLRINTNVQAIAARNSLGTVKRRQEKSLNDLSSGSRINKASDDAAGLAISEKLKAHIRSTRQASRNVGDGISLIQTAEGGLSEIANLLIRLRELSVQSASDTIGEEERKITDLEFQQLSQEVDRISTATTYQGKALISGEGDAMDFQIGIMNNEINDRLSYNPEEVDSKADTLGVAGLNIQTKDDARENIEKIDKAIENLSSNRARLGSLQNRLVSTMNNLDVQNENLSEANSRIRDTDIAEATAELAQTNILVSSSTAVLAQANVAPKIALSLIG